MMIMYLCSARSAEAEGRQIKVRMRSECVTNISLN